MNHCNFDDLERVRDHTRNLARELQEHEDAQLAAAKDRLALAQSQYDQTKGIIDNIALRNRIGAIA